MIMKTIMQKMVPGVAVVALLVPGVAMAAGLGDVLKTVSDLLNMVVPILLTLAIIVFMWGVVQYLFSGAGDKKTAINIMVMGVIAIAVMVSIWGLVGVLQSTFGIQGQNSPIVPGTVKLERNG